MEEIENHTVANDNVEAEPLLIEHTEDALVAELMLKMNAFVSIETAEKLTTLDKTTQYRERIKGRFPKPETITHLGRRKGYRIQDLIKWSENPARYSCQ
ncbi:hypothetical protein [Ekhidna sp.]|jgi:predicted DNA-binding transcriptional regulator AlpA|uniref:helix-turn-helix transcriptional regulator n=1 Tax=Ekhidna sp. TaxID=2608089 RepID=UPI0032EF84CE